MAEQKADEQPIFTVRHLRGVRTIALLEAGKGAMALLAGSGLLLLWNANLQEVGDELLRHLHLNPGRLQGNVLWRALTNSGNDHLHLLALGVLCYALVRFTEATGLWFDRRWAEWLGVLSGGIYVPFEIRELVHRPGLLSFTLLALNLLIVAYLSLRLARRRSRT
jgi:uncharacterized membrane protein (DUF2068 family)